MMASAPKPASSLALKDLIAPHRAAVMGVLNLTPDSFSDGGRFVDPQVAIAHATEMVAEGADIIDVGAESTRPYGGMRPVTAEIEQARLEPVLPAVIGLGKPVSIDTMKAKVADWAIRNGAAIANDVWGLQRDPDMAHVVAAHGVPVIVMHNRDAADPAIDIVDDMLRYFERSLAIADAAGIRRAQIVHRSGYRVRQDAGTERDRGRETRAAGMLRSADPDRAVAQALYFLHRGVGADPAAGRIDCRAFARRAGRRRDRAHARCVRNNAGASGRRSDRESQIMANIK